MAGRIAAALNAAWSATQSARAQLIVSTPFPENAEVIGAQEPPAFPREWAPGDVLDKEAAPRDAAVAELTAPVSLSGFK